MNLKIVNNKTKSLVISLIFHILLITLYIFYFYNPEKKQQEKTLIPIKCLCCCSSTEQSREPDKPKEIIEEKVAKKKTVKEDIVDEKTVIKKQVAQEMITKNPSIKKEIIEEKTVETKPQDTKSSQTQPTKEPFAEKQAHEVIKKVEQIAPKQIQKDQEEEFTTTNFSLIRDMATKNLYYPTKAQRMGWSGTTEIKIVIDTNGKLLEATIKKSSGRELLDSSALESVLALKDEILPKPKKISTLILPISFSLKQ